MLGIVLTDSYTICVTVTQQDILPTLFRCGDWGSERLCNHSGPSPVPSRTRIRNQNSCSFHCTTRLPHHPLCTILIKLDWNGHWQEPLLSGCPFYSPMAITIESFSMCVRQICLPSFHPLAPSAIWVTKNKPNHSFTELSNIWRYGIKFYYVRPYSIYFVRPGISERDPIWIACDFIPNHIGHYLVIT